MSRLLRQVREGFGRVHLPYAPDMKHPNLVLAVPLSRPATGQYFRLSFLFCK